MEDNGIIDGAEEDERVEATSPLTELRDMRQRISEDRIKDIDIPGYNGRLVARYRKLSHEEVEKINRRVAKLREKRNPNAVLFGHCDVLAEALIGIYLRKDPSKPDELESLNVGYGENGTGEATWLDAAKVVLDEEAQLPSDASHRQAVRAVFGNDLAVAPHQIEYAAWARALVEEEEEDFAFNF